LPTALLPPFEISQFRFYPNSVPFISEFYPNFLTSYEKAALSDKPDIVKPKNFWSDQRRVSFGAMLFY